jgi:hypothetical protein
MDNTTSVASAFLIAVSMKRITRRWRGASREKQGWCIRRMADGAQTESLRKRAKLLGLELLDPATGELLVTPVS